MAPPREPVYSKDEKVLCFHHELLYEAKVLEARYSDPNDKKSPMQYRIHYKGWKNTWDDWVPQDRLRKLNDENKQLAQNLKSEMDDQSSRAAVKTSSNNNKKKKTAGSDLSSARGSEDRQSLPPTGRGTKRGRDNEIEKVSKKPRAPPKSEAKIDNPAPGPSAVSPPKAAVRHSTRTRKPTAKATLDSKGPRPLRAKASATKRPNEVQEQGAGPSEKVQNGASKEVQEVQEQGSGPSGKVQNGAPKDAHKPREGSLCLVVAGYPLDNPPQGLSKKANGQQTRRQTRTRAEEERAADEDELQEEQYNARPAVKIECPDLLKGILVDDWEHVTRDLQILSLPAKHPVREILDTYFEEEKGKRRLGSAEADLLEEMVAGMKQYFDKTLGKMLLYRFEREQYFRIRQAMDKGDPEFKDKAIGDIYGPEFLARLFVSLPELIAQTNMDAQSVQKLKHEAAAMTHWLSKNANRFFVDEYETPGQEYLDRIKAN